ncbi:MAG: aminodeoxychorismate synthase component I [Bacteroidales bacterium]|nr:aminodeoxychorismate synthase component I [Bacteroidales bacterium]
MNRLGSQQMPFLFVIDFEGNKPLVFPVDAAADQQIYYNIKGSSNTDFQQSGLPDQLIFSRHPVHPDVYKRAFEIVRNGLEYGDSYLLNLTFATAVETNFSLPQLFVSGNAPYRLLFRDEFVVFSPECFVRISDNTIRSFPMKGTIYAGLPDAAAKLLNNPKETAEHHTIVDLIRNDLSMVAEHVRVERFRYLEEIKTNQKHLLQASSEISGQLLPGWEANIGSLLQTLLPAGSVSGAPKKRTIEIIREAEKSDRGYYTGVFGLFDGKNLDSAVMIRFIEQRSSGLFFRSGGGITVNSDAESEYRELIDKVYVPAV